jgi:sugar phosphate isomerase/epimerase
MPGQLRLVHVSDSGRGLPGEGEVDFAAVLAALRGVAYTGWLGFECRKIVTDEDVAALGRSLAWLRDLDTRRTGKEEGNG